MHTIGHATVFHVRDLEASLAWYRDVLGFEGEFQAPEYGYAGIRLGEVRLHLSANAREGYPDSYGQAYVFCDAVDEYYRGVVARGARTLGEPKDWPYGMRDFDAVDPDGNQVTFGCVRAKM